MYLIIFVQRKKLLFKYAICGKIIIADAALFFGHIITDVAAGNDQVENRCRKKHRYRSENRILRGNYLRSREPHHSFYLRFLLISHTCEINLKRRVES